MLRFFILLRLTITIANVDAQWYGFPAFASSYRGSDEYFLLNADEPVTKTALPCNHIQFIDNRYDTSLLGFFPIYKRIPKKIRLNDELPLWMQSQFEKMFTRNEKEPRQLLIVIQKLWFSPEAHEKFSLLKQRLQIGLYYNLEVYSRLNDQYFAIKRLQGDFHTTFYEQTAYQVLTDSLFGLLQNVLPETDYEVREAKNKTIDSTTLFKYLNDKKQRLPQNTFQKGIYASYDDFIQQKVMSDSVEVVKSYDYYQSKMVGCNLGVYIQGELQSCNQCWGYFDGRFLYLNSGNGFFMRLRQLGNQFILADLQDVAMQTIHKSIMSDVMIGNSTYGNIKDFAKTYRLFYQLDYDNGKLF